MIKALAFCGALFKSMRVSCLGLNQILTLYCIKSSLLFLLCTVIQYLVFQSISAHQSLYPFPELVQGRWAGFTSYLISATALK